MSMKLIVTKDRKVAITRDMFSIILESLNKATEVNSWGTDYKVENNKTIYFFWAKFKPFEQYPSFIGLIHECYGRNIDVRTLFTGSDNLWEINIRGYSKELK